MYSAAFAATAITVATASATVRYPFSYSSIATHTITSSSLLSPFSSTSFRHFTFSSSKLSSSSSHAISSSPFTSSHRIKQFPTQCVSPFQRRSYQLTSASTRSVFHPRPAFLPAKPSSCPPSSSSSSSSLFFYSSPSFHSLSFRPHGGHGHSHGPSTPRSLKQIDQEREQERRLSPSYIAARAQESDRITILGMLANIGLALFKAAAGIVGNSVALIADAIHSISDLVTDFITLWSSRLSNRPRDEVYPYGHGKFEAVGALAVSAALIVTGGGIGYHAFESAQRLWLGDSLGHPTSIALLAAIVSIGVKEMLYWSTLRVGKKYNSNVIIANAWHHRSDSVSTCVALVGVVGSMISLPMLDPIAGIAVSAMVAKAGVELGWESLKDLTDRNVEPQIMKQVQEVLKDLIGEKGGVVSYHMLRGRRMGPTTLMDVHICVDPHLSVSVSHQIAERVRLTLMNAIPSLGEVLVHVDIEEDAYRLANAQHQHDQQHDHQHDHHDDHHEHETEEHAKHGDSDGSSEGNVSSARNKNSKDHSLPLLDNHHHDASDLSELMRPQPEIERDVRRVLSSPSFQPLILGLTHFTCHYVNNRLTVQFEVVMDPQLKIADARRVAKRLDTAIRNEVPDVFGIDVHLELMDSHIEKAVVVGEEAEIKRIEAREGEEEIQVGRNNKDNKSIGNSMDESGSGSKLSVPKDDHALEYQKKQ